MGAAEPVEPAVAPGNSAGHGNSQHASNSAAANASAASRADRSGRHTRQRRGHGNSRTLHTRRQQALRGRPSRSNLASHPAIARATVTRSTPRTRQLRTASAADEPTEPGVASGHGHSQPHHTRPLQASWGRPSRSKLTSHPAIARATVTRSTPRIRQLRTHQRPTSRQNRVPHPATATRPQHTRRQQALMGAAEPVETGDVPGNSAGHGNSQASPSAAPNASAPAQPVEFASWTGGEQEPAFHFKNQGVPSSPIEVVELEQLKDWPVLPGHAGELPAIPQVGPAAMEEHAASHVNNGQPHAPAHLPHELLI